MTATLIEDGAIPVHKFPSIRGVQDGFPVYATMITAWRYVALFERWDEDLDPLLRGQRKINPKHAQEFASYLLAGKNITIPPVIVEVDIQALEFYPLSETEELGILEFPVDAVRFITDGQHRHEGLKRAKALETPSLGTESIPVIVFPFISVERSQQRSADINRNALKMDADLAAAYDLRTYKVARKVVEKSAILLAIVGMEKKSGETKLLRFKHFADANREIWEALEKERDHEALNQGFCRAYWSAVAEAIPLWECVGEGKGFTLDKSLKATIAESVCTSAIVLAALGKLGASLSVTHNSKTKDLPNLLAPLEQVNWTKWNREWVGRCLLPDTTSKTPKLKLYKRKDTIESTYLYLKQRCGIELTEAEAKSAEAFLTWHNNLTAQFYGEEE